MGLRLKTAPVVEPISLDKAKLHMRVDGNEDDTYIAGLITAAREYVEDHTGRQLIPATWELTLDRFPTGVVLIPRAPYRAINSVKYVDLDGVLQTLSSSTYMVDDSLEPARLIRAYGYFWPSVRVWTNAITIEFEAGYDDADDVPDSLKQAILMYASHLYENREPVNIGNIVTPINEGLDALLRMHRVEVIC